MGGGGGGGTDIDGGKTTYQKGKNETAVEKWWNQVKAE